MNLKPILAIALLLMTGTALAGKTTTAEAHGDFALAEHNAFLEEGTVVRLRELNGCSLLGKIVKSPPVDKSLIRSRGGWGLVVSDESCLLSGGKVGQVKVSGFSELYGPLTAGQKIFIMINR